jgi:hypothetical protein
MQLKSVSLLKKIKEGDTYKNTYPIQVSPTISKFGADGLGKIQMVLITKDNHKEYINRVELRRFCERTIKLLDTIELGNDLLGYKEVEKAVNAMYVKRTAKKETSEVIELNGVKGTIVEGKFIPLDDIDLETV